MSRRRGEFEHRTSIFEGAFRAWSHLGGLDPEVLELHAAADLDPLTNPIDNDSRAASQKKNGDMKKGRTLNLDGTIRREYPYEPLPRSGLAHPYVQAILSPWLGPDADNEAIQLGLTTLRTWWQHRRKGESGSAIAALGTEKMKGVVEGYTRHFFTLAHCLVVNDREQPPRTLHSKMKELEKMRARGNKKRTRDDEGMPVNMAVAGIDEISVAEEEIMDDANLTPLERAHQAQRRHLTEQGGFQPLGYEPPLSQLQPVIQLKNKCVPDKIDLPQVVDAVVSHASQLVHQGQSLLPHMVTSGGMQMQCGDPNTTPVVFVSSNGSIQIALTVDGITCAHCVKIVETVLKGCNGNKSPIEGLLDAAADHSLLSVLIKIDKASNAKRIAFESTRNLSMVGYTAKPKEMSIVGQGADKKSTMDLGALSTAFEVVANVEAKDVFDWALPCTCPDNGILRGDCARHSQMNKGIFEAFESREKQVEDYMAGCGMKYGMDCTCGPSCRCKNCPLHKNGKYSDRMDAAMQSNGGMDMVQQQPIMDDESFDVDQPLFSDFGMGPPASLHAVGGPGSGLQQYAEADNQPVGTYHHHQAGHHSAVRNPSIISYGNGLRGMSITSETTFGRAMSGLSALSIDWENLEDFDIDVDHSANINSGLIPAVGGEPSGSRRTSFRRSYVSSTDQDGNHVSFRV